MSWEICEQFLLNLDFVLNIELLTFVLMFQSSFNRDEVLIEETIIIKRWVIVTIDFDQPFTAIFQPWRFIYGTYFMLISNEYFLIFFSPNKADFIRAKYQFLAYVNKQKDKDINTVDDLSQVRLTTITVISRANASL